MVVGCLSYDNQQRISLSFNLVNRLLNRNYFYWLIRLQIMRKYTMSNQNNTNALTDLIDSGVREGYTRCSFKNASDRTRMVAKAWNADAPAGKKYSFLTMTEGQYDHILFPTISLVNNLPAVSIKMDKAYTDATAKQKDEAWAQIRAKAEAGSLNLFVDDIESKYCK